MYVKFYAVVARFRLDLGPTGAFSSVALSRDFRSEVTLESLKIFSVS